VIRLKYYITLSPSLKYLLSLFAIKIHSNYGIQEQMKSMEEYLVSWECEGEGAGYFWREVEN
jgi:hypothetical protein